MAKQSIERIPKCPIFLKYWEHMCVSVLTDICDTKNLLKSVFNMSNNNRRTNIHYSNRKIIWHDVSLWKQSKNFLEEKICNSDGFDQDGFNKEGFDKDSFSVSGSNADGCNRNKERIDNEEKVQQAIEKNPWKFY